MKLPQEHKNSSRQGRSESTQAALMQAAEKLIAERGIENVSIRDIISSAGQKNESALQYHFKNFTGLIDAIHARRSAETQTKRAELVEALLAETPTPSLRQICELMVRPIFELARLKVEFRRYTKAFGHELVLSETSALSKVTSQGGGGVSGQQVATMLKQALPELDEEAYRRRMESAVRLCSASMYHQARQKNAFRGDQADLFYHSLIDALVGLLNAPESDETKAIARVVSRK
jgi:AcrR family transcriptional regulator